MKPGRAIWAAYDDTGALAVTCTNCAARQGQWCSHPDGRVRRVPCVDRAAASISSVSSRPYPARDFTEPTHPPLEKRTTTSDD